ncbi:hypothetical protein RND81_05G091800 [Saponaria officinalis]|uniref:Uncharacterized protein n=1 Tax=Saponaria officinalis TaxID=3572 RepID=A0AAW1KWF8_SAPOF
MSNIVNNLRQLLSSSSSVNGATITKRGDDYVLKHEFVIPKTFKKAVTKIEDPSENLEDALEAAVVIPGVRFIQVTNGNTLTIIGEMSYEDIFNNLDELGQLISFSTLESIVS